MSEMKRPVWRHGYWGVHSSVQPYGEGTMLYDQRPWYGGFRFVNSRNEGGPPRLRPRTVLRVSPAKEGSTP